MTDGEKTVMLRSVVTGFIIIGKPLTSSEVANHMKRLGVWIRNRDVAQFLRENVVSISDEYGMDYTVHLICVDGVNVLNHTNLYHPESYYAGDYLARDITAITPGEFEAMHGIPAFLVKEECEVQEVVQEIVEDVEPVKKERVYKFNFPTH